MPHRTRRAKAITCEAAYLAWKAAAAADLERRHGIAAMLIPEHVWANLYVRRLDAKEAAERAEIYHRIMQPAGKLWRKPKRDRSLS